MLEVLPAAEVELTAAELLLLEPAPPPAPPTEFAWLTTTGEKPVLGQAHLNMHHMSMPNSMNAGQRNKSLLSVKAERFLHTALATPILIDALREKLPSQNTSNQIYQSNKERHVNQSQFPSKLPEVSTVPLPKSFPSKHLAISHHTMLTLFTQHKTNEDSPPVVRGCHNHGNTYHTLNPITPRTKHNQFLAPHFCCTIFPMMYDVRGTVSTSTLPQSNSPCPHVAPGSSPCTASQPHKSSGPIHTGCVPASTFAHKFACKPFDVACLQAV